MAMWGEGLSGTFEWPTADLNQPDPPAGRAASRSRTRPCPIPGSPGPGCPRRIRLILLAPAPERRAEAFLASWESCTTPLIILAAVLPLVGQFAEDPDP